MKCADEFIRSRRKFDEAVAKVLNFKYEEASKKSEENVRGKKALEVGQRVKYLLPKETHLSTVKMEPRWAGPYKILRRLGEHSYEVEVAPGKTTEAHRDQLAEWVDDVFIGKPTPLYYYAAISDALEEDWWPLREVLKHRVRGGKWEFLTS